MKMIRIGASDNWYRDLILTRLERGRVRMFTVPEYHCFSEEIYNFEEFSSGTRLSLINEETLIRTISHIGDLINVYAVINEISEKVKLTVFYLEIIIDLSKFELLEEAKRNCSLDTCELYMSGFQWNGEEHPSVQFAMIEIKKYKHLHRHVMKIITDPNSDSDTTFRRLSYVFFEITNKRFCSCMSRAAMRLLFTGEDN